MFSSATPPPLVVSETDIEAALTHLQSLLYRNVMPDAWERKHLLNMLSEAIGKNPKVGQCVNVAPGVFGIIKPFGVDLLRTESSPDGRLQVWLAIRQCGTDLTRITEV
jgi:hypothetical protein